MQAAAVSRLYPPIACPWHLSYPFPQSYAPLLGVLMPKIVVGAMRTARDKERSLLTIVYLRLRLRICKLNISTSPIDADVSCTSTWVRQLVVLLESN